MKIRGEDWVTAGLRLLRDGGETALTIDRLCVTLARTKGSFYHHFADIAAYHAALLDAWARLHTELPIAAAAVAPEPAQRRKLLYRAVRDVDLGLELAVHAWAVRAPVARAAVARVHERRIAYLTALAGGGSDARNRAELEYAAFIGALHVYPDDARRRQALTSRLAKLP
jgi:AcrR family transcriptional regulator